MLNRIVGFVLAGLMLLANGAVIFHDVLPGLMIGEPPRALGVQLDASAEANLQLRIDDENGRLVGRSWTRSHRNGEIAQTTSNTVLNPISLPTGGQLPPLRIATELTYRLPDAGVDTLAVTLHGIPEMPVSLRGETMPSKEFACKWQVGQETGRIVFGSRFTRAIGDVVRPFEALPELYVGRQWQMKMINPLACLSPNQTEDNVFYSVTVAVTGKERVTHNNQSVEAFVVEAPQTRAWVLPDGRVIRQEVNLPLLGRLTLIDEPYSQKVYDAAIQSVPVLR